MYVRFKKFRIAKSSTKKLICDSAMIDKRTLPSGHPIDEKKAKELISGDLKKEYRRILQSSRTVF